MAANLGVMLEAVCVPCCAQIEDDEGVPPEGLKKAGAWWLVHHCVAAGTKYHTHLRERSCLCGVGGLQRPWKGWRQGGGTGCVHQLAVLGFQQHELCVWN